MINSISFGLHGTVDIIFRYKRGWYLISGCLARYVSCFLTVIETVTQAAFLYGDIGLAVVLVVVLLFNYYGNCNSNEKSAGSWEGEMIGQY